MPTLRLCFEEAQIAEYARRYPEGWDEAALKAGATARERGYLTRGEFLEVAKWKSPRPTKSYERNTEQTIAQTTRLALDAGHDLERVIILTALSGVRVRTATALLHMCHREPCPLLDVWAMTALGVPRETTELWDELDWLRVYPEYATFCRQLARKTGHPVRTVDRALWTYGEGVGTRRRRANPRTT